jgi:tetratricopeptide (TPR) repeat protein
MKASQPSAVLVIIMVCVAAVAIMPIPAAGNDARQAVTPVAAMSKPELRQLCRDGNADTPIQTGADGSAILQHYEQSRAACDRLVEASGIQGRDLAVSLLDRADLEAPGQEDSYKQALADYARAIALSPDTADAYWRRGKANLLYSRDLAAALKDLDEAIRLDPSQAEFYVTRASILGSLKEPDSAFADLNLTLARDPRSVHALTNRGLAYFNNGDTSLALADFDAALSLSPADSGLYSFRAAARREAGDEAGAKADEAKMAELMLGPAQ